MSSVQERLQLKRVPLDTWNIREQLCLASAVVRSGDQNWMSVSRALKTVGEPNRPPDWYSQKSCAAQYGALLENVETPKRKKRNSESGVETPQESILKQLTQQRIHEIQNTLAEMNNQYEQLKNEIIEVRNQSTSDERIQELWSSIEAAKRARERENARRAAWLKEREERRARAERTWRPSQTPPPTTPTSAPPSSPLLTSLLKSSPVVTTPQHIPHPATVVDAVSPSAGAPTLSALLEPPDSKLAAIEHIKSQLVQIEHELQASTQSSVPQPMIQATPAVDIDDIEIKAEDVYAFRDIDIHIPPVTALHKGNIRLPEKPIQKKEIDIATTITTSSTATITTAIETLTTATTTTTTEPTEIFTETIIDNVKEEPVLEEPLPEVTTIQEPMMVEEQQTVEEIQKDNNEFEQQQQQDYQQQDHQQQEQQQHQEQQQQEQQQEEEVKIVFPEVKFPTPEIKVIQPDEQKIKEEIKEPEIEIAQEKIEEHKEEVVEKPEDNVAEEPEKIEETVTEELTVEEPVVPPVEETAPEVITDPQDIPLPPELDQLEETEEHEEKRETEEIQEIKVSDVEEIKQPEPETRTEEPVEIKQEITEEAPAEQVQEEIQKEIPETFEEKPVEDIKKEEDAEDSIPLKEMIREELSQEEIKRERLEEDTHTETDDDTPMELSREEEKDGKKKRDYSRKKKSDSRTCSGSESAPDSPSASEAERQHRLWRKSVMLVYSRLCAHKYASLFLRPISDEEAPGYSAAVRRPMDLSTVRRNIDAGNIRTTAEFQRDVLLMLSNALLYNSSSHSVYAMAREMHEEAQCQLGMLLAAQAHAGLCAPPRRKRRLEATVNSGKQPRL